MNVTRQKITFNRWIYTLEDDKQIVRVQLVGWDNFRRACKTKNINLPKHYSDIISAKENPVLCDAKIKLNFTKDDIESLRSKFEINSVEDIYNAVWECINTYMEM